MSESGASIPHTHWYRIFIRGKTRVTLAWLFSIALVFLANSGPYWPGIALCFLGAVLRFWASGYLRKDRQVAVGGPYAWTRNPLYLGTFLMALGAALSIEAWWLMAAITLSFVGIYHFIILDEEEKLETYFGKPYQDYLERVPRFFPRPWPTPVESLKEINSNPEVQKFSSPLAFENKAYEPFAAFVALIGFIWLIVELKLTLLN